MLSKTPNRRLVPFYKRLGSEFSALHRRGTMLVYTPTERIVGGFHFDPTILDENKRWLSYFATPLFLPDTSVSLSFGDRIPEFPSGQGYDIVSVTGDDEADIERTIQIMRETLPLVQSMLSLDGIYKYLEARIAKSPANYDYVYETMTYTALLLGRPQDAEAHIEDFLMSHILDYGDASLENEKIQDFQKLKLQRFFLIRDLLRKKRYDDAKKQIDEWQDFTVKSLKIEDLV